MRPLVLLFVILFVSSCSEEKKQNRKASKLFDEGVALTIRAENAAEKGKNDQAELFNTFALEKYEETLALDPDHKGAISALGHTHFLLHEYKEAADYYQKALEINPTAISYTIEYALSLINIGNTEKGKELLENALESDDSQETLDYVVYGLMDMGLLAFENGELYEKQGESEAANQYKKFAITSLIIAHEFDSTNNEVITHIVELSEVIGDDQTADYYSNRRSEKE